MLRVNVRRRRWRASLANYAYHAGYVVKEVEYLLGRFEPECWSTDVAAENEPAGACFHAWIIDHVVAFSTRWFTPTKPG